MRAVFTSILCSACGFAVGFGLTRLELFKAEQKLTGSSGQMTDAPAPPSREHTTSTQRIDAVLTLAEKPRDHARDLALFTALQALNAAELKQSAPQIVTLLAEKQSFASLVGEAWMERWLEVDAPAALEFLTASRIFDEVDPDGKWKSGFFVSAFEGAFKAVARHQPEWARNYVAAQKADARRDCAVFHLSEAAARNDPRGAKAFLGDLLDSANRSAALDGYVTGLAESSSTEAFQVGLQEPPGPLRTKLLQHVLWAASALGEGTLRALLTRIDDPALRAELTDNAIGNIAHRTRENILPWLKEELERASRAGTANLNTEWSWALQEALRGDRFKDCADWALGLSVDPDRNILARVVDRWVDTDLSDARQWLSQNANRIDAIAISRSKLSLQQLVLKDVAAAETWVETLPAGPLRDDIRLELALGQAHDGKPLQAQATYARVTNIDTSGALAKGVAAALADSDCENAAAWVATLPPGPAQSAALREVAEQWAKRDPPAAGAWIAQLPAGKDRDAAFGEIAAKVVYLNPQAASDWILEIEDERAREMAAGRVHFVWQMEAPSSAAAWVKELPGVSERWRQEILTPP